MNSPADALPVFEFEFAYILPGNDLDGETITVRATSEDAAFAIAKQRVAQVSRRIGLRLVETRKTAFVTSSPTRVA